MLTLLKIAEDHAVAIAYTLHNQDGELLDEGTAEDPLWYLHGYDNLLPAFEANLLGRTVGDEVAFVLPPEEGYGVRSDEALQKIERSLLPEGLEPEVDQELFADFGMGPQPVRISAVTPTEVELDLNHPLAGQTLHFAVKVLQIRQADPEEIAHGHVHSPGHHHH